MKKLLTLAVLAVTAGFAFGQGQVSYLNGTTTYISTNGTTSGVLKGALGSYYGAMFAAPVGTTDASLFTLVSYGTNMTAAGYINGGTGTASPIINGTAIGSSVAILFRAWSGNLAGKDWTAVSQAVASISGGAASVGPSEGFYYGQSAIATVIAGGGTTPIPTPFGTGPGQIGGYTLNYVPVPEPTTFALAGLAGAAMLIFRRRR